MVKWKNMEKLGEKGKKQEKMGKNEKIWEQIKNYYSYF